MSKKAVVASIVLFVILPAVFLGGFSVSRYSFGAVNGLADRVERKWLELSGQPSELESRYALVETTNLRLAGRVYDVPRSEFTSGGAMTPWGEDLLVMHRRGTIRRLVEGEGVFPTSISAPENGLEDYERIAHSDEFKDLRHRPDRMRFNDLLFVDVAGLHGLAISYSFFDADNLCYGSRVAWLEIPLEAQPGTFQADPSDWELLFETSPCLELNPSWTAFDGIMAGGRMDVDETGTLFFGSGEYHLDGVHTYDVGIQSPDNDYGKVIAIDLLTRNVRHYSTGHRNMQGVAIDTKGRIWTTEHMIRGGDELNLVREDHNYGWPLETYGTLYSGLPFPNQGEDGRHVLHQSPAYAWLPSAGVSSLTAIDGFHPTWDGDLLAGSLAGTEHGQSLFRIRIEGDAVIFAERIRLEGRIRYVTQWGPDRIAVMIDHANVVVVFRAQERVDVLARALAEIEDDLQPETFRQVAQVAQTCNECHSFEQNVQMTGPSLAGVVGRKIGVSFYQNYSDALMSHGGNWDDDALRAYLSDPSEFAPGTSMPGQGLEDGPVLDGLISLLKAAGNLSEEHLGYN